MALNGCCATVKYIMVLINLLFWVLGIAIIGCAIWMLTDPTFLFSMTEETNNYIIGLYTFLAVGTLILIVAFLGCCGAFKKSQCMLVTFFCCLLIVLVAEIAAGAWAFHHKNKLHESVKTAVLHTIKDEYSIIKSRTIAFDTFQKQLQCCGADNPTDWALSKYNNLDSDKVITLMVSKSVPSYKVPPSCCKEGITEKQCEDGRQIIMLSNLYTHIYDQGCVEKLIGIIEDNWIIVLLVTVAIILLELFALIFSLALCCAIKNDDHYKA